MQTKELEEIEFVADKNYSILQEPAFVKVDRLLLRNHYKDGSLSRVYCFDTVTLPFADAVAIVIYYIDQDRKIWVGLRESTRPSVYFRKYDSCKRKLDRKEYLVYREIVAGGIEYRDLEKGGMGIDGRAALEVFEEAGFEVESSQIEALGGGIFSSPGSGKEKIHFRAVRVDPKEQKTPKGDGHPLEEAGRVVFTELGDILKKCYIGEIEDGKTEIGVRRLANHLGFIPELGMWLDELPPNIKNNYSSIGFTCRKDSQDEYAGVSAALVVSGNKILITQRPPDKLFPLKWEFPGGKIDQGETPESCLKREIREELDVEIEIVKPCCIVCYRYPEFSIHLNTFWCKIKSSTVKLLEHNDCRWVNVERLDSFDFVEADRLVISQLKKTGIPPILA